MGKRKPGSKLVWIVGSLLGLASIPIVLPVFTPGCFIDPSKKTACLSHLKQLSIGLIAYSADYDERFPDRDSWMDAERPYVKSDTEIFRCPLLAQSNDPVVYGYCFNGKLTNAKNNHSSTTPMIFESVNVSRNASGTIESLPKPGRHKGVNNLAYSDGHAHPGENCAEPK